MIAIGAAGGVALAGVALVDWHYALRYVGTLGAQLSLINWLRSYDNPQVCSMDDTTCPEADQAGRYFQTAYKICTVYWG